MHVEVLEAVAVAIEASILFNFILNHHYTFKGYGSYVIRTQRESLDLILLKMGKFNIGALGGAAISFTTFTIIFKVVHLNYLIADIVDIGMAMSWS